MFIADLPLPLTTSGFWMRYVIVLVLAILVCFRSRSPLVVCTALGICVAGFVASFFENQQRAEISLVLGLTLGPLFGILIETLQTRDRRMESFIGRRFARQHDCPHCRHRFTTVQQTAQCPRCEHLVEISPPVPDTQQRAMR